MAWVLDGRVAVITGGGSGIGRAIALAFAQEGATLAILDLRVADAQETVAQCGGGLALELDVRDEAQVTAVMADVVAQLGTPWVLVNSAGIGPAHTVLETTGEAWREVLAVNLDGTFFCAREAVRAMLDAGVEGRIVNISSQIGMKGGERLTHYAASKAGVHGMTRSMARELAPQGILVNAIAPGPISTELLLAMPDEWLENQKSEVPLKRFGRVEEIAPMALLLASPVAGANITGAVMNISGGDVMSD